MTQKEKQNALDEAKWILSEQKGHDCCGEFDYCIKCDKSINDPCAIAFNLYNAPKKASKQSVDVKETAKTEQKKPTNTTTAQITKPQNAPQRSRSGRKLAGTK